MNAISSKYTYKNQQPEQPNNYVTTTDMTRKQGCYLVDYVDQCFQIQFVSPSRR